MSSSRPKPPADPVIEAYKLAIDRSLIRRNLRRSVEERIEALLEAIAELEAIREERDRGGET